MGLLALLGLVASATSCVFILGTGLSTLGGAAATGGGGPGGAGGQSSAVLDLNFADLAAAAQVCCVLCVVCASHQIVVSAPRHPAHTFSVRADSSF